MDGATSGEAASDDAAGQAIGVRPGARVRWHKMLTFRLPVGHAVVKSVYSRYIRQCEVPVR